MSPKVIKRLYFDKRFNISIKKYFEKSNLSFRHCIKSISEEIIKNIVYCSFRNRTKLQMRHVMDTALHFVLSLETSKIYYFTAQEHTIRYIKIFLQLAILHCIEVYPASYFFFLQGKIICERLK